MIDFERAFSTAWERMVIILFRSFHFEKWFLIGFSAFLAVMAEGGVSFSNPVPIPKTPGADVHPPQMENLGQGIHMIAMTFAPLLHPELAMVKIYYVVTLVLTVVWVVMNWVGSRGEFILLDNIVRNRAALASPWQRYARQGNIWFIFHFVVLILSYVLMIGAVAGFLMLNWSWISAERDPKGAEIGGLAVFILVVIAVFLLYSIFAFFIQSIVLPLYFRQTQSLGQCLLALGRLLVHQPVNMLLFLLANLVLGFFAGLLACVLVAVACCLTCTVSCIPVLGPAILGFVLCQLILPIVVFTRCFQLQCLADMGPEYDVWNVDLLPGGPAAPPAFSPPPRLG